MKKRSKMLAYSAALACVMALTACGAGNNGNTAVETSPSPSPSASAPTTSPVPSAGPDESAAPPSEPSTDRPSGDSGQSDSGGNAASDASVKRLKELLALAKKGEAPGISFAAHTALIDDVEKKWGKADKTEPAGKGIYATYGKRDAVFGFNKGSQIFDVRSSAPELQTLTLKQIESVLGRPVDVTKNGGDSIYIYKANDQFQLKFIIPKSTGKVDHISVFSPQDTVNNMAG